MDEEIFLLSGAAQSEALYFAGHCAVCDISAGVFAHWGAGGVGPGGFCGAEK